ncbi:hypothetical protein [Streptomyces sp. NPDC005244]|uniref:hypothetical protein n=1 Tax=Streptomyces sp. NPDC005244 TaxID=3364708 RepID=UPI00367E9DF2
MSEVVAEPYEDDEDWDGTVDGAAPEAEPEPKKRGRKPLTFAKVAGDFERATVKFDKAQKAFDTHASRLKAAHLKYEAVKSEGAHIGPALEEAGEVLDAARAAFEEAHAALNGE